MPNITKHQAAKVKSHVDIISTHINQLRFYLDKVSPEQSTELNEIISAQYPFHLSLDELSNEVTKWQDNVRETMYNIDF